MKKVLFFGVLILVSLIIGESYYFNGQYVGKYIGAGDEVQRDYTALDEAKAFEEVGDVQGANDVYKKLIQTTDDDIVLERSIREYGRNLAQGDALAGLQKKIELASNPRIRATARAGAVEGLARGYFYNAGVSAGVLSAEIFKNSPFTELRARSGDGTPEYVVLLEYANLLSPRPVVTAILAEHYAQELYMGDARVDVDLEKMLSLLDTLIPEIPEGSPNRPPALTYTASALLYASAAGNDYDGRYPDQVFTAAVTDAESIIGQVVRMFEYNVQIDAEQLQRLLEQSHFSPVEQFVAIFTTLTKVPETNQAEAIFDEYRQYMDTHTDTPAVLQSLLQELTKKYPTAQDLLEIQ